MLHRSPGPNCQEHLTAAVARENTCTLPSAASRVPSRCPPDCRAAAQCWPGWGTRLTPRTDIGLLAVPTALPTKDSEMHTRTYTHINTCSHVLTHAQMCTRTHTHMLTCAHTCSHAHIHTCSHAHMHTHLHTHTCTHMLNAHTLTHVHTYTHMFTHTHAHTRTRPVV